MDLLKKHGLTFNVEENVICVQFVLRTDLALVDALIHRTDVLNDEAPFAHPLVEVDADPTVRSKRIHSDGQRMDLRRLLPRDLTNTGERRTFEDTCTCIHTYIHGYMQGWRLRGTEGRFPPNFEVGRRQTLTSPKY